MHVGAALREVARRHSERTALIDGGTAWTYGQFVARIVRFGNALHSLGLTRGDRVALLVPDIREYLEADYGAMSGGFVRVPLDPRMTGAELAQALRHAGARALVTHDSFGAIAAGLRAEVPSLGFVIGIGAPFDGALGYDSLLRNASDQPLPDGDGDDLATLNFSGGTTSAPKAVLLRHRNLVTAARATMRGFVIAPEAVFLNVRPLWPIAQIILMSYVLAGATVVLGGRFEASGFADLVARSGATRTSLVPTQLVRLLDHLHTGDGRVAALQAIHVGGSRIPSEIFARALGLLGPRIGVLYGLTEAPVTCYMPPAHLDTTAEQQRVRMESVGTVLPDYEVKLAPHTGEVLVRGGNVMAGYWRDEAATRAALDGEWLHTGDLGRFDPDGRLCIIGRLKEVIRTGSSSVLPKEVEDAIALHPAVSEVAVVGLPDPEWGEAVTAFVVLKAGMAASEHALIEHCRAHLAAHKKPRAVRFVARLPRSHYGKVLRAQLIAEAGDGA